MQRIVGRLERVDLGAGGYAVATPDGARVVLHGDVPDAWVGKRVQVQGRSTSDAGFLMTGDPAVEVSEIALVD